MSASVRKPSWVNDATRFERSNGACLRGTVQAAAQPWCPFEWILRLESGRHPVRVATTRVAPDRVATGWKNWQPRSGSARRTPSPVRESVPAKRAGVRGARCPEKSHPSPVPLSRIRPLPDGRGEAQRHSRAPFRGLGMTARAARRAPSPVRESVPAKRAGVRDERLQDGACGRIADWAPIGRTSF